MRISTRSIQVYLHVHTCSLQYSLVYFFTSITGSSNELIMMAEYKRSILKFFLVFLCICAGCFGLQYLYANDKFNFESRFHYSINSIKKYVSGMTDNDTRVKTVSSINSTGPGYNHVSVNGSRTVILNTTSRQSVKVVSTSAPSPAVSKSVVVPVTSNVPVNQQPANNQPLPICPIIPPKLVGPLKVELQVPSFEELEKLHPELGPGGHFKPKECTARSKMAIVIPYRARPEQLRVFLHHMHPMLQRQQLDYAIYVVEPAMPVTFNRGMLMNVGFVEALKLYDWQCFVFHDVDLYPENDRNIYSCPEMPRHMTPAVDKFQYRLPYVSIFGGGSSFKTEHYKKINGFSNKYFGWGGEDDDLWKRVHNRGLKVIRYPMEIARYKMFSHTHEKSNAVNPQRFDLLRTANQRQASDGLNKMRYTVLKVEQKRLYTWVNVKIDQNEVMRS